MKGFNNLLWFMGVVEDNEDATNAGRVRVRAFNVHPPKSEDVPTAHLPWATVIDGTYGLAHHIPSVGDWVFGFFIDGKECNHPMIVGRLPGVDFMFPKGSGRRGESGYIPAESLKNFGKPPLNRYVSGEEANVAGESVRGASQTSNVSTAIDDVVWSEPSVLTPERNLDTKVIQSKEGNNVITMTDTEDGEATTILISHASGSLIQIDPSGTVFVKALGDMYSSTEGSSHYRSNHDMHVNVDQDWTVKVERGSAIFDIQGDLDIKCNNFNLEARASANIDVGSSLNMSATKIGLFATQDDINLVGFNQIKMAATNPLGSNIVMKAPFGDFQLQAYSANIHTSSYIAMDSFGAPDVYGLYPRLNPGIDIMCPTHVTLSSGLGTTPAIASSFVGVGSDVSSALGLAPPRSTLKLDATGSATLTADAFIKTQSLLSTTMLSLVDINLSSTLATNIVAGGSAKLSAGIDATVFAGGIANLTGATNVSISGATTAITGTASMNVSGGETRVSGAGALQLTAGGVASIGGATTQLGVSGAPATPAVPGVIGVPATPPLPIFAYPAFHNISESAAVITPKDLEGVKPFIGVKADRVEGIPKTTVLTSRDSA